MKQIIEKLMQAAKAANEANAHLQAVVEETEKTLAAGRDLPEYQKLQKELAEFMNRTATFEISEDNDPETRYALNVHTTSHGLARLMARICGCPEEELPEENCYGFEASDRWHGNGKVNLRTLADELSIENGQFFDIVLPICTSKIANCETAVIA